MGGAFVFLHDLEGFADTVGNPAGLIDLHAVTALTLLGAVLLHAPARLRKAIVTDFTWWSLGRAVVA